METICILDPLSASHFQRKRALLGITAELQGLSNRPKVGHQKYLS